MVATKRNQRVTEKETTGKCGLEALMLAKTAIEIFEMEMTEKFKNVYDRRIWIMIGAANDQRKRVYQRLKKSGFKTGKVEHVEVLLKRIDSNGL